MSEPRSADLLLNFSSAGSYDILKERNGTLGATASRGSPVHLPCLLHILPLHRQITTSCRASQEPAEGSSPLEDKQEPLALCLLLKCFSQVLLSLQEVLPAVPAHAEPSSLAGGRLIGLSGQASLSSSSSPFPCSVNITGCNAARLGEDQVPGWAGLKSNSQDVRVG